MSSFLRRLGLFVLLLLLTNALISFALPMDLFTYRGFETLQPAYFSFGGPYYPDQDVTLVGSGDLADRSSYRVLRVERWVTDAYGLRYDGNAMQDFDVVIVGDSNLLGAGVTQAQVLNSQLERRIGRPVYPFARDDAVNYLAQPRFTDPAPQIVIWQRVERHLSPALCPLDRLNEYEAIEASEPGTRPLRVGVDRYLRSVDYLGRYLISLADIDSNLLIGEDRMLFFPDSLAMLPVESIPAVVERIVACQQVIEARGSRFIFLPLPDRENIYCEWMPDGLGSVPCEERDDFLRGLIEALREAGVEVADILTPLQAAAAEGRILYQRDDTHWDVEAIELAAETLADMIATD